MAGAVIVVAAMAHAEDPEFDRPGIAFAPATLPARSWAWEQGLPDFQRDRSNGVTQHAYAAGTRFRYGINDRWEVQAAIPAFEHVEENGSGRAFTASGTGDLSIAAKYGVLAAGGPFTMAVLAAVSFPVASRRELGNDDEQYSFGATVGHTLTDNQSIALYANVDLLHGDATWTLSPSWSFALGNTVGGYVEAGIQPAMHGESANNVGGGGITWMVRPTIQLDLYFLAGLTRQSTDLAAGCGVSVFVQ